LPEMAIFTDGWFYHASPLHNRIADDAAKRAALREAGYYVLSLTTRDLEPEEVSVPWFDPRVRDGLIMEQKLSPHALERITRPGIDLLVEWIHAPDPDHRRRVAAAVPTF